MSKRKTEQAGGSKKKNKSNLESLSGQLDKDSVLRDVPNGASRPARMVAPAGVERFSDDEEETIDFNAVFKKADRTMTTLLKVNGEKAKRKVKVEQMQKAAVSDSEEDEGIADQMEVTARQQADALQAEEGDPEPVVLQQVLFHTQVANPTVGELGAIQELVDGCSEYLQGLSPVAAGSVDILSTLLLNGWLQRYCFSMTQLQQCTPGLVQSLFQLLARSNSLKVATAAYKTLLVLLGDTHQHQALTGSLTRLPTVSPLYSAAPQPPRLEAVPTDQDFIAALQSLGFQSQPAATANDSKQHSLSENHEQQPAKGTMYHLQLVLRTWAAVCRYRSKDQNAVALAGAGLQQLLLILLALRMDPVGQLLAIETQIALDALLTVYTDQDWQQSFSSLANKVTAVGPSHRAHLVALKFLPAHSPRGFALQQAAAASLLQGLCTLPSKSSTGVQASRHFSAEVPVAPEEVVQACSWFQAGGAAMAKACQGEQGGEASFSLWEAETCIKAADLLLWPHVKQAKQTGEGGLTAEFKPKWQEFIQALSRGLSNSHKVAAHSLKLHIAFMQAWDK
ncbi:hypothetical protein ABBQ32_006679 [Trebouxia sp. C0010 RCD-2024]